MRERTLDVALANIDLCAALGGTVLVHGSPKQRSLSDGDDPDDGRARAVDLFRRVAEKAEAAGIVYCLEALSADETNFVNRIADAVAIVEEVNSPAFDTMIDTGAVARAEDLSVDGSIRRWMPSGHIRHVQFNDRNRRAAGQGDDDFEPVLRALKETGYDRDHRHGAVHLRAEPGCLRGLYARLRQGHMGDIAVTAPKFTVVDVERRERAVALRMPFRFGVVTLREAPQAFIRARIRFVDGTESWGQAAELMVPKWFDKSPELSNDDNFDQLRTALGLYAEAITANSASTAFGHHASLYQSHLDAGAAADLTPLAANYGPALIDRAVFDAVCRARQVDMATALKHNLAGMRPQRLLPDFNGFDFDGFLSSLEPLQSLHIRHTVGLIDPLTEDEIAADSRVGDGLPEALDEVIARYGHSYFKIKVGGDVDEDVARLTAIAAVLDRSPSPYHVTLDGNEQYDDVDGVLYLFEAMRAEPSLKRFRDAILFVEQPIRRARTRLERDVGKLAEMLPVIIDESDGDLAAFELARSRGYAGVSSKDCKGFLQIPDQCRPVPEMVRRRRKTLFHER